MNALVRSNRRYFVAPFDEVDLLRREVEARFGRHIPSPSQGPRPADHPAGPRGMDRPAAEDRSTQPDQL